MAVSSASRSSTPQPGAAVPLQPVLAQPQCLDVAIVGAGLCGLALARTLVQRGLTVQVLEARARLGGRVRTAHGTNTGLALDLGPTWFWPETEPLLAALLAELGLPSFEQHDPGDALWLTDPNRQAERRVENGGVHAGARRIAGGAAQLVQALAATLPPACIRLNHAILALVDAGSHIALQSANGDTLHARQVVLALPPRLVLQHISCTPALPDAVQQALHNNPTWMAAQAKALTSFEKNFWQQDGQSGNAFVRHPQAVLAEVFDCSAADGVHATDAANAARGANAAAGALGGFVALHAAQRQEFRRGLPLLIASQLAQLYGAQAQDGELFLQDWATEPWTCSDVDRLQAPEPPQSDPLLRQPLWNGRLLLGGSETAAHGAGHMEGALESADRVAHALLRAQASELRAGQPQSAAAARAAAPHSRAAAIGAFSSGVLALRTGAPERYRLHLTRLLQARQSEQLTQRSLLATVDQCYSEALARLDGLLPGLDAGHADVINGRHALGAALLAPFEGWSKALLEAALDFNAGSCAVSNFPQEHRPDADSLRAITLDLAAAWREFAIELNTRLLVAAELWVAAAAGTQ